MKNLMKTENKRLTDTQAVKTAKRQFSSSSFYYIFNFHFLLVSNTELERFSYSVIPIQPWRGRIKLSRLSIQFDINKMLIHLC